MTDPRSPDVRSPAREEELHDYRRRKLQLADVVRGVMNVARERDDEDSARRARDLLAHLAEDPLQLAVVGQFNRGKSTLMNAVLGRSYLPTGVLPTTSVITNVRYGSKLRVQIRRSHSSFPVDIPLAQLARYVAESGDGGGGDGVSAADLEVPAEILRLGFAFVDTPGIGSAIVANTGTTERFLPEADAVIFVTSADSPLTRG